MGGKFLSESINFLSFILFINLISCVTHAAASNSAEEGDRCKWTQWMSRTNGSFNDIETLSLLRISYPEANICEQPTDIECYDLTNDEAVPKSDGKQSIICSPSYGLECKLFCNDYKVRFKCCYIPPTPIGPWFQLRSKINGKCVEASPLIEDKVLRVGLQGCQNFTDPLQRWAWVSDDRLINEGNRQCIAYNATQAAMVTVNCDDKELELEWESEEDALLHTGTNKYLGSGNAKLNYRAAKSKWEAVVDIGSGTLSQMLSFPCSNPPMGPDNGSTQCSFGSYLGSECNFQCNEGFVLSDDSDTRSVCRKNGRFGDAIATCEQAKCTPEVTTIPHGNSITCTNDNLYESTCTVSSCMDGYRFKDDLTTTTCHASGWSQMPVCQRVTCPPPQASSVPNLEYPVCDNTEYFYQTQCTYTCKKGFEIVGSSTRTCLVNGKWDIPQPTCARISCGELTQPLNGVMSCSSADNEVDNFEYTSTCQFTCNQGFTLHGSTFVTCTHKRTWNANPPVCRKKTCSVQQRPLNGDVDCSEDNFFGSRCIFTCDTGYQLTSDIQLVCTEDGWDAGAPQCQAKLCVRPGEILNGKRACTNDNWFGSQCQYQCDDGYIVKGTESQTKKIITCLDGGWTDSIPICEVQLCYPELGKEEHGDWQCRANNQYGSTCTLDCDAGYVAKMDGKTGASKLCKLGGSWTEGDASCQRMKCPKKTLPEHGSIHCTNGEYYGSECRFACDPGYNLYGAEVTTCLDTGWDQLSKPSCNEIQCYPNLTSPKNGSLVCDGKLNCTYSCEKGFELKGARTAYCKPSQNWDNSQPRTCERIKCPPLASPDHGFVRCNNPNNLYLTQCSYTCEIGYKLVISNDGNGFTKCSEDKTWSWPPPICSRVKCVDPPQIANGRITCSNDHYYNTNCSLKCNVGYRKISSDDNHYQICLQSGKWSHNEWPYCEQSQCEPFYSNPGNGKAQCSDRNLFNSTCKFSCVKGFKLEGPDTSHCTMEGWSTNETPSCKKITCPMKEMTSQSMMYMIKSCTDDGDLDSICTFDCQIGYELMGPSSRQCMEDGRWNDTMPLCQEVKCVELSVENAQVSNCTNDNNFQSSCDVRCLPGFELATQEIAGNYTSVDVKCEEDKEWSGLDSLQCVAIIIPASTTTATTESPTTQLSSVTTSSTVEKIETTTSNSTTDIDGRARQGDGDGSKQGGVSTLTVIIIVVIAVLLIIIIIIVTWKMRTGRRKKYHRNGGVSSMDPFLYPPSIDSRGHREDRELRQLLPSVSSFRQYNSVPLEKLELEFNRRHADDDKLLREEFCNLPEGKGARDQGEKIQNKDKNRYTNIIPFDHSRVVLPKSNTSNETDYINASFVDGYKHKGKFISAQGPKENTIVDFWRMVWDQNVTTIIMVTNLVEGKEVKCAQYWPTSGTLMYGDLAVTTVSENHLVDYTIRQFSLQQLGMTRTLFQYHFTSWPDFGVPKSPSGMLKFMRRIKQYNPPGYGAIIVHCSAGVGRTGTYICIDAMVDMMVRENKIDVYGFVSQLRTQRPEMVQTEQQYIFIYQALLENHLYGDTEIEASEVAGHIDELSQKMPGNITGLEHEFKKLTNIRIQKDQMRAGNHPSNMRKNRVLLILPYDWNRVIIPFVPGIENSDYINASYIDGYRQKDTYIATQGPLDHTVHDFWRMVWDTQSASIVMLTQLVEKNQVKCEQYWPESGVLQFGTLLVDCGDVVRNENYVTRDFVISSSQDLTGRRQFVRQFQYLQWPETGPPDSGYSMIELIDQVQKQQQASGNHPIVIHCSAGAGRTGAFCALSTALEQVKAEGVLDMFQVVKCLRMQRPHMVQNLEQYEFCYRTVGEYIDSMCEYCNFK